MESSISTWMSQYQYESPMANNHLNFANVNGNIQPQQPGNGVFYARDPYVFHNPGVMPPELGSSVHDVIDFEEHPVSDADCGNLTTYQLWTLNEEGTKNSAQDIKRMRALHSAAVNDKIKGGLSIQGFG